LLIDPGIKFIFRLSKTLLLAGDDVGTCAHQEIKVNNFVSTQLKTKPFLVDNNV
jgi:hypothetical protein